jgi:hypothetical protein
MSDVTAIVIAGITIIPSTLAAILSLRNGRQIEVVRKDVNGKMAQMLQMAEAKGHADEKAGT